MALTIKWSRQADLKFDNLIEYLHQEWGELATKAFIKRTHDLLDILAEFPEIGSIEVSEKQIRGLVVVKQITLFYKVNNHSIVILNFYDNRQSPKKKRFKYRSK